MDYKIIFLDIDGTLINSEKVITPKTKKALINAQKCGYRAAIASGRPDHGIIPYAKELEFDRFGGYILAFNGGHIINFKTGETVYKRSLIRNAFVKAYNFAKQNNVDIVTYKNDTILAETTDNEFLKFEAAINKLPVDVVENLPRYVDFEVPKCLMLADGGILEKLEPELRDILLGEAGVFRSEPFFLEIMPENTNKATSAERLIELLGIDRSEAIACGDGYNDVTMLKYAGLGVAMENACEAAKSAADFITYSNDNDGIAYVIERFIQSEY